MNLFLDIQNAIVLDGHILATSVRGYRVIEADTSAGVEMYPGGFCLSFPLKGKEGKKCLRLLHRDDVYDNDHRIKDWDHIKNVSEYFSVHEIPYVVSYELENQALLLEDNKTIIPGIVMDWIEGDTLLEYIVRNYQDSFAINKVAEQFLYMVQFLNENGFAHGDLSGHNIIVDSNGQLKLIDYDSFYISGYTEEIKPSTSGVRCYQHPERRNMKYLSRTMDYFSQQIIYLSLLAISEDPSIFNKNIEKGILFSEEDIDKNTFVQRDTYKKIKSIRNDKIQYCLNELERAISGPLSAVRSIVDLEKQGFVGKLMATYCDFCGHRFEKPEDKYCPICGRKRESL